MLHDPDRKAMDIIKVPRQDFFEEEKPTSGREINRVRVWFRFLDLKRSPLPTYAGLAVVAFILAGATNKLLASVGTADTTGPKATSSFNVEYKNTPTQQSTDNQPVKTTTPDTSTPATTPTTTTTTTTATTTVPKPTDMKVRILNGTTKTGAAATLQDHLKNAGYQITGIGNASSHYDASQIYYRGTDHQAWAQALAKDIPDLAPQIQEADQSLLGNGVDLLVVIGLK